MLIVTSLLLFLFTGAILSLLLWTSMELFRAQEDPLGDRLEALQSQAMVVAARATRRKKSAQGLDRFLNLIAVVPGGEDWMNGTEKLLAQERAGDVLHFRAPVRVRAGGGDGLPAARQP